MDDDAPSLQMRFAYGWITNHGCTLMVGGSNSARAGVEVGKIGSANTDDSKGKEHSKMYDRCLQLAMAIDAHTVHLALLTEVGVDCAWVRPGRSALSCDLKQGWNPRGRPRFTCLTGLALD